MRFCRQTAHLLICTFSPIFCLSTFVFILSAGNVVLVNGATGDQATGLSRVDAILVAEKPEVYDTEHAKSFTISTPLSQTIKLTATGLISDNFGVVVAIDANTAVVGASSADVNNQRNQGAAYVFVRSGAAWVQQARLIANDGVAGEQFGSAVAVNADTIIVGAPRASQSAGSAYVFTRVNGVWTQQAKLTAAGHSTGNDWFGVAVALKGEIAIIGADRTDTGTGRAGAAYVFTGSGSNWSAPQRISSTEAVAGDRFGAAVALAVGVEGVTAVIGAYQTKVGNNTGQGAAYIFTRNGVNTWLQQARLSAPDGAPSDNFGIAVAISGDTGLIGAYKADVGGKPERGAAYVFVRNLTGWRQQARLIANGGTGQDFFGISVALDGDRAMVGATKVDVAGKKEQGAAYLFMRSGETWVQRERMVADDGAGGDQFGTDVAVSGDTALVGAYEADIDVIQDNRGAAYLFPVEPIPVDLTLALTANPSGLVLPGQTLVYTLQYGNSGGINATGVTIQATVPEYTHFSANGSSNGWSCADGSGPHTRCTVAIGAVAAKGTGVLTFAVTVAPTLPATVTQIVTSADIVDDGVQGADLIPYNNQAFAYTAVAATPLIVNKSVFPTIAQPGDVVTYTIAITATQNAPSIVLTDTLPPGLSFERLLNSAATVHLGPPTQIRFNGAIPVGNSIRIVYRATVNAQRGSILFNETIVDSNSLRYAGSATVSVPRAQAVHTLMLIYANGNNNLAPHMIDLFQKAETAAGAADWETLFLLDGPGNDDAYSYLLQADQDQRENCPTTSNPTCNNRYQENTNRWRWGDDTSTYSSLKEFVTHAIQTYPAQRVLLALVGHGGGWSPDFLPGQPPFHDEKPTADPLGGLLWDAYPSLSLSTADLGRALRDSKAETGRQIDLLYLDACLMAMAEVAYEVHESVDYLLASENWSWTSFRYDKHLAVGTQLSVAELGRQWIKNEADELRGDDVTRVNYPFTYSLLDLRPIELLLEKGNALAAALTTSLSDVGNKNLILDAFTHTECFDGNQNFIRTDDYYCDLFSFAQQLESRFQDNAAVVQAAQELWTVITDTIRVAEDHNNGRPWQRPDVRWEWKNLGGLSIYLPLGQDDWKRIYYSEAHLRFAAEGLWDEFLNSYWTSPAPLAPDACASTCAPIGPARLIPYAIYLPTVHK